MRKETKEFDAENELTELSDSEHSLSLDHFLHRAIIRWQDAMESALKASTNSSGEAIDAGIRNRVIAGEMVVSVAKAKGVVHWDVLPESTDPTINKIIKKNNEEAKKFQKRLEEFKDEIEKQGSIEKNMKNMKITDFKVEEILKSIAGTGEKHGTLIV